MEVNGAPKQPDYKLSSFVFSRTKNFIQVWIYLRVSKWQNFHFWVNYPFNSADFYEYFTIQGKISKKHNGAVQTICLQQIYKYCYLQEKWLLNHM